MLTKYREYDWRNYGPDYDYQSYGYGEDEGPDGDREQYYGRRSYDDAYGPDYGRRSYNYSYSREYREEPRYSSSYYRERDYERGWGGYRERRYERDWSDRRPGYTSGWSYSRAASYGSCWGE